MYCKRSLKARYTQTRRPSGFSFIEVMVVVVIIGMLAGAVAMTVTDYMVTAKTNRAKSDIATIVDAIDAYYLLNNRYPTNDEGLEVLKLKNRKDPWGRQYEYNSPGQEGPYEVYTLGEDGRDGGEGVNADIYSWKMDGDEEGES